MYITYSETCVNVNDGQGFMQDQIIASHTCLDVNC